MAAWSKAELHKIAEADDLHISPFREDGVTYGTPTWIWSVAVDDALYVRGYNGVKSRWYQAAVRQKAGRIKAAGITKEVVFEPVDDGVINDHIDEAYRAKYTKSPYLKPMARVLVPRPSGLRRSRLCEFNAIINKKPGIRTRPMKPLSLIIISACLVSAGTMHGQNQAVAPNVSSASSLQDLHAIKITRSGSQRVTEGAATHFTGSVHIEPLFDAKDPSRTVGASVTFEPNARTVWHTHPLGQTLIVTAGVGWIQQWGGPVEDIRKGDVVWIPPGTKHWHGATATNSMTHIAITEELNGNVVTWLERVGDEQYRKR